MDRRQFSIGASALLAGCATPAPDSRTAATQWRLLDTVAYAGKQDDISFVSPNVGWYGNGAGKLYRTQDGGATWTQAYRSTRPLENCWKMSFPSRRIGYATVQNYADGATERVVIKTTDGGASWRELPLVSDARVREFGVGFINDDWGWVGSSTTGFETRDGGASWQPIEMGRAVNKIRVVRDGGVTRAFAIGVNVSRLDL